MRTPKKNLRTGTPVWLAKPWPNIPTEELTSNQQADIVIIGAGITGVMAADALSDAGFKVIMLDRRGPLKGATSATTALLQYEIDQPLSLLSKKIGEKDAARAWRRSKLALESLAAKMQSLEIKFSRHISLYLSGNVLDAEGLQKEGEMRKEIGLYTDYLTRAQLLERFNIRTNAALLSYDNLTVNPVEMAASFLQSAIQKGAKIFAPVTVEKVDPDTDHVLVQAENGAIISARYAIYATGYEVPKGILTKKHSIHSTYAIATKRQKQKLWPESALIWESADPYLYVRTTDDGRVICGGEDEEFESAEKRDALLPAKIKILQKKLKTLFPQLDTKAEFAWCGSFGASDTGLPTIGEIPAMPNCFAILAFGGNGITYSRIAAELLASTLTGKQDPEADLFAF